MRTMLSRSMEQGAWERRREEDKIRLGGGTFGKGGNGPRHELGVYQGLLEAGPLLNTGSDADGRREAAGRRLPFS